MLSSFAVQVRISLSFGSLIGSEVASECVATSNLVDKLSCLSGLRLIARFLVRQSVTGISFPGLKITYIYIVVIPPSLLEDTSVHLIRV